MLMAASEPVMSNCQLTEPVATKRASMPVKASETTGRKMRFPSTTSSSLAVPGALLPSMLHISWLAAAAGCAGVDTAETVRASGVTACAVDVPAAELKAIGCLDCGECVRSVDVMLGDACPQSWS